MGLQNPDEKRYVKMMNAIPKTESDAPIRSVTIIARRWLSVKEDPIVSAAAVESSWSMSSLDSSMNDLAGQRPVETWCCPSHREI